MPAGLVNLAGILPGTLCLCFGHGCLRIVRIRAMPWTFSSLGDETGHGITSKLTEMGQTCAECLDCAIVFA